MRAADYLQVNFLEPSTAAVGTAWLLLGSHQTGHAASYRFQKTFAVSRVHSQLLPMWAFLKRTEHAWWSMRIASHVTSLRL